MTRTTAWGEAIHGSPGLLHVYAPYRKAYRPIAAPDALQGQSLQVRRLMAAQGPGQQGTFCLPSGGATCSGHFYELAILARADPHRGADAAVAALFGSRPEILCRSADERRRSARRSRLWSKTSNPGSSPSSSSSAEDQAPPRRSATHALSRWPVRAFPRRTAVSSATTSSTHHPVPWR